VKQKYITAGVCDQISLTTQMMIWGLAASIPCEKDYLQVFRLEPGTVNGRPVQKIKLSQEVPPYEHVCSFCCENPITEKLFLITDGDNDDSCNGMQTLLLAEEY